MAKATYAKNFRFFRAFRVRKKIDLSELSEINFLIKFIAHLLSRFIRVSDPFFLVKDCVDLTP